MSYSPPPGLRNVQSSNSSAPQPHPSLPARPPPSTTGGFKPAFSASQNGAPGTNSYGGGGRGQASNGFTAFKPRAVGGPGQGWGNEISSGPQPPSNYPTPSTGYGQGSYQQQQYGYQAQAQPQYYPQPQGAQPYSQTPPQIQNPFPLPGQGGKGSYDNASYDPEMEAQIAQWQSAYAARDDNTTYKGSGTGTGAASAGGANAIPVANKPTPLSNQEVATAVSGDSGVASVVQGADGKQKTVVRSGGGESWQDSSLLEWDPAHFRLFVGNLAGEVTDDSLLKAFGKFDSIQKARVIRDKRTTKSKGFGFVSFSDGDQYFQAVKDMQGKYIGSHPVLLKRSTTDIKPVAPANKNKKNNKGGKGSQGGGKGGGGGGRGAEGHAETGAGVKKHPKTKGGLKLLG